MQVTIPNDWFTDKLFTINDARGYLKVGHTYDVNELVHHKNFQVRLEAASHGYGLNVLVNDEDYHVRWAVADQGYSLDVLVNDKDTIVRAAVARQGYGLDVLINDEYYWVREKVAKQGYGLDILVNDKSWEVREAVTNYLKEYGYKSIDYWAKANPDKVHGTMNIETTDHLKEFVYKVDDSNSLKTESSYESADAFFNDSSKESYESNEALVILTVDTNVPLIKLEKSIKDDKQVYKFIVDIINEAAGNEFIIKSIINSKDKFSRLLESTINALNNNSQFSKYADDLECCL